MFHPLSIPLQAGFCFFPHPLPTTLSASLARDFPGVQEHDWFPTFHRCTMHGLGSASPPVVLVSASEELRTPEPTTHLLVKLFSIFSLLSMTTFISDSLSLAIPCLALAPNCLMLAVVTSPHSSVTALTGAATLSQALFIQLGRAPEAELRVRSSFRESLRLHL